MKHKSTRKHFITRCKSSPMIINIPLKEVMGDQRIRQKCFECHLEEEEANLLLCTNEYCSKRYCFKCIEKEYQKMKWETFNDIKAANNWTCNSCHLPKKTNALDVNDFIREEKNNYLGRKRYRLKLKIKRKNRNMVYAVNLDTLAKANVHNQTVVEQIKKLIAQSTEMINKIDDPNAYYYDSKRPIENDNDNGNDINDTSLLAGNKTLTKEEIKKSQEIYTKDKLKYFFPNYLLNVQLNKIIVKAAVVSHSCRIHKGRKKENKPCIFCRQYKCPNGIEIVKFKTYGDLICFLNTFFSEIEGYLSKEHSSDKEFYKKILYQKECLFKLQDNLGNLKDPLINGLKRFCSNCIANAFRERNGVYWIYDSFKDEDEQATLDLNRKIEIIEGLQALIIEEKEKSPKVNDLYDENTKENCSKTVEPKKKINIFNQIFSCSSINDSNIKVNNNHKPNPFDNNTKRNNDHNKDKKKSNNINCISNTISSNSINNEDFDQIDLVNVKSNKIEPIIPSNFTLEITSPKENHTNTIANNVTVTKQSNPNNTIIQLQEQNFSINSIKPAQTNPIPINNNVATNLYTTPTNSLLYEYFTGLYNNYLFPMESIDFFSTTQVNNLLYNTNLFPKPPQKVSDHTIDQLFIELSFINAKVQEKTDLMSRFSSELNEFYKYSSSVLNSFK